MYGIKAGSQYDAGSYVTDLTDVISLSLIASFLVCSMALNFAIYIYICMYIYVYVSGRPSFRKCSKCFYVYLNIRSM